MVAIEPMTDSDVDAVLAIDRDSFHAIDLGSARGGDHLATREAQLREELARSWARLRVARSSDGTVLGYVLFWHVVDEVHLLNVAVRTASRRSRVGTLLVDDVITYARANSAAKVLLEVRASNAAAIRLYETLGFEPFNVRRRYYDDGEDGLEMVRSI